MLPARWLNLWVAVLLAVTFSYSCSRIQHVPAADVIVVGAGIAGLAAALEASSQGATVLVIEVNSVGGGHAVKAGGLAMVNTQLQRDKGISDSADIAWRDFTNWGEDADPYWTRRYAEESGNEVYDWLTQLGVRFTLVLDTPEDTVPRFHFAGGPAVNVVLPMMRRAFNDPNISFRWNTRATALLRSRGAINGVATRNERTGRKERYRATSVILTTGGFQNNLDMVRLNWPADRNTPERLLKGAGNFATGDGYRMAEWAGADLNRMNRQVTFYTGVPDPRDTSGTRGAFALNPASIWLDNLGRRFVNESADSKTVENAASQLDPASFWMVFDARGARRFALRGTTRFDTNAVREEFLANPAITARADSLAELARQTGIPAQNLLASVQIWNRMLDAGADYQFGRFDPGQKPAGTRPISEPPYYAVRMYPLTRKSMGGPAINNVGQVVNEERSPVRGLYAAGELTGVAGINGSHGGSGTFLGPAVLTGRIAGRQAAMDSGRSVLLAVQPATAAGNLVPDYGLPGYWHYDAVHQLASERASTCDSCHSDQSPMAAATRPGEMLARLETCTRCH
jgi:predicted oxidoreductase